MLVTSPAELKKRGRSDGVVRNRRGDTFPTIAVPSVEKVIFKIEPEPFMAVDPNAETRNTLGVPGSMLHVAPIPAAPAMVPDVEHPKFEPVGSITAGSKLILN
jgi:hypothetical protein